MFEYTLSPNKKPSNCVFAPTNFLLFAARCKSGVCNFLFYIVFVRAHEGFFGCRKGLRGHGWGRPAKAFRLPQGASWARLNLGVDFLIFGRANLAPKFLIPTFSYSSPWVYLYSILIRVPPGPCFFGFL